MRPAERYLCFARALVLAATGTAVGCASAVGPTGSEAGAAESGLATRDASAVDRASAPDAVAAACPPSTRDINPVCTPGLRCHYDEPCYGTPLPIDCECSASGEWACDSWCQGPLPPPDLPA